jgi:transcriptional regulator with XRE-family HTH domain
MSPQAFGRRLRLARERLGIPLETIAESTKIKRSLLVDLERGDVSKWPLGIYRRAFIREYAATIGLPADEIVSESIELFPEEGGPTNAGPVRRHGELRLTLAADPNQAALGTLWRLAVAMVELSAVLGLGWVLTPFVGAGFWTVSGAIALVYYPLAAVCVTRVPAFRLSSALLASSGGPSLRELIHAVLNRARAHSDEHVA